MKAHLFVDITGILINTERMLSRFSLLSSSSIRQSEVLKPASSY